jgi:hypothetical protein
MLRKIAFILTIILMITACHQPVPKENPAAEAISNEKITETVKQVAEKFQLSETALVEKGVRHAASLWRSTDGTADDFAKFCTENFIDPAKKEASFYRFCEYFESLYGHFNKITLDLQENVQLMKG